MTNSRTMSSPVARMGWIILTVITLILYLGFVAPSWLTRTASTPAT